MECQDYMPPRDEFRVTPSTSIETSFRHSGWKRQRQAVWAALVSLHVHPGRLDRFSNCGSGCCVEYSPSTGACRLSANYCHDRLCVPCAAARSAQVTRALLQGAAGRDVRFMTLTLRHSQTPLRSQIDRLYASFARLRRGAWFRSVCTGGAGVLEVKVGEDGLWHVHLHALVLGGFIDQRRLSQEWHSITGDSYIVDVRKVQNDQAVRYVGAYSGKPLDASIYRDPDRLREFALAIKGRRLINLWGDWAKLDLDAADPAAPVDWIVVGRLDQLVRDAGRGDPWATSLLNALHDSGIHRFDAS